MNTKKICVVSLEYIKRHGSLKHYILPKGSINILYSIPSNKIEKTIEIKVCLTNLSLEDIKYITSQVQPRYGFNCTGCNELFWEVVE